MSYDINLALEQNDEVALKSALESSTYNFGVIDATTAVMYLDVLRKAQAENSDISLSDMLIALRGI